MAWVQESSPIGMDLRETANRIRDSRPLRNAGRCLSTSLKVNPWRNRKKIFSGSYTLYGIHQSKVPAFPRPN
jgi:hypothetical protein